MFTSFKKDFEILMQNRLMRNYKISIANNPEAQKYSDEISRIEQEICEKLGAKYQGLFQELEDAISLHEGAQIDSAYLQGFCDGMQFQSILARYFAVDKED